ncbi:MAG: formate acetyltransferase, partial [Clostridia bacterium]|nr:formate acetyltransferase [Clostridia bacterium]
MDLYKGFKGEKWKSEINVADFIANNYKEYKGDESFLAGKSKRTSAVWSKCDKLLAKERKVRILDVDLEHISGIDSFPAGYIDKKNEVIVGLQTDKPLKRIVN